MFWAAQDLLIRQLLLTFGSPLLTEGDCFFVPFLLPLLELLDWLPNPLEHWTGRKQRVRSTKLGMANMDGENGLQRWLGALCCLQDEIAAPSSACAA